MNKNIKNIKKHTKKPIIIGFGIKNEKDVNRVMKIADGLVVGTEIVKLQDNIKKFENLIQKIIWLRIKMMVGCLSKSLLQVIGV